MSERHLDEAIDRAVREIMDVDADAAFRARVLGRLDRRASQWPRWAAAFVAAGAGLLAFVLMRPANIQPVPPRAEVAGAARTTTDRPVAGRTTGPLRLSEQPSGAPASRRPRTVKISPNPTHRIAAGTMAAAVANDARLESDPPAVTIESLGRLEPLVLEPLQTPRIGPTALSIDPLSRAPEVQIIPLSPPNERN